MISESDKAKIRNADFEGFKKLNKTMKAILKYIEFIHNKDVISLEEEIQVLKQQIKRLEKK